MTQVVYENVDHSVGSNSVLLPAYLYTDYYYGSPRTFEVGRFDSNEWNSRYRRGEKRSKPEGFKNPTAYYVSFRDGRPKAYYSGPSSFTYVHPPRGAGLPSENHTVHGGKFSYGTYTSAKTVPSYIVGGAKNKALSNLNGNGASLGLAFAERAKTADLVGQSAKRLAKAVRNLKRGRLTAAMESLGLRPSKGLRSASKDAASLWLELQYGWLPTIGDVNAAVSLLAERDLDNPKRYTVSSTGKYRDHDITKTKPVVSISYTTQKLYFEQEIANFYSAKCRLDGYLDNPLLGDLSAFGFTDFAAILWELIPWSFVGDWFLPVGNYLSLLDATNGITFRSGSITSNSEVLRGVKFSHAKYPLDVGLEPSYFRHFVSSRTTLTSFPKPALFYNRDPFSTKRMWNAIALLRTSFK